jgi:transcriptional regulator with XRE-family HTH domain
MASPKGALRSYRVKNKLSAGVVAEKLGIAASTLRSYENGNREVDGDFAVKIEKTLGIDRVLIRPDLFRQRRAA